MLQRRSLKELIDIQEPGWPLVQSWIAAAQNQVEVLASDRTLGEEVLLHFQMTTRSPIAIYPFLFTTEGDSVVERSRRPIPMDELWHLHLDLVQQLADRSDD